MNANEKEGKEKKVNMGGRSRNARRSSGADDGAVELAALGAELLLGFAARPAACLHRSDSESLCSLRQPTIRPPPGCTSAHRFYASSAQAARIAASDG